MRHLPWVQNLGGHQKAPLKPNTSVINLCYFNAIFLKRKLMQKIHDEQNIKI